MSNNIKGMLSMQQCRSVTTAIPSTSSFFRFFSYWR